MSDRLRDDYLAARLAFLTGREPRHGVEQDDDVDNEFPLLSQQVEEPPSQQRRPQFSRVHVWVLAAVCVVGVVVMLVFLGRGRTVETIPTTVEPSIVSSPTVTPEAVIRVHVIGAVQSPGVVELKPGDRVADAVSAAGGLGADAAPGDLNLAEPVPDGAQIVIGTHAQPAGEVRPPGASDAVNLSPGASGSTLLNLNHADATALEALPGVGPVTATRIVEWRTSHGKFSSVDELQEVPGIGPKTFSQLQPLVTV